MCARWDIKYNLLQKSKYLLNICKFVYENITHIEIEVAIYEVLLLHISATQI